MGLVRPGFGRRLLRATVLAGLLTLYLPLLRRVAGRLARSRAGLGERREPC